MIRRLCLFLLMFCLVLPATAAPLHCAPLAVADMHHMDADHGGAAKGKADAPAGQVAKHDCIGCIAPFTAAKFPEKPLPPAVARLKIPDELQIAGAQAGPETPPPRS